MCASMSGSIFAKEIDDQGAVARYLHKTQSCITRSLAASSGRGKFKWVNLAHATMWLPNGALVNLGHLGCIADSSLFLRSIGRTGTTTPSGKCVSVRYGTVRTWASNAEQTKAIKVTLAADRNAARTAERPRTRSTHWMHNYCGTERSS